MNTERESIELSLKNGSAVHVTPKGNSMRPFITAGKDSVIVENIRPKVHDIALYKDSDGEYVLHRVIKTDGETYVMCGDRQIQTETVGKEQILGTVTGILRGSKLRNAKCAPYRLWGRMWCVMWLRKAVRRLKGGM